MDPDVINRFEKIEKSVAELELQLTEKRKGKKKLIVVAQYAVNLAIICVGVIIALSKIDLGIAAMAIGASLLFNQFNSEDTEEIKTLLKNIKDQLDRIEKK